MISVWVCNLSVNVSRLTQPVHNITSREEQLNLVTRIHQNIETNQSIRLFIYIGKLYGILEIKGMNFISLLRTF